MEWGTLATICLGGGGLGSSVFILFLQRHFKKNDEGKKTTGKTTRLHLLPPETLKDYETIMMIHDQEDREKQLQNLVKITLKHSGPTVAHCITEYLQDSKLKNDTLGLIVDEAVAIGNFNVAVEVTADITDKKMHDKLLMLILSSKSESTTSN